eukprot:106139_1
MSPEYASVSASAMALARHWQLDRDVGGRHTMVVLEDLDYAKEAHLEILKFHGSSKQAYSLDYDPYSDACPYLELIAADFKPFPSYLLGLGLYNYKSFSTAGSMTTIQTLNVPKGHLHHPGRPPATMFPHLDAVVVFSMDPPSGVKTGKNEPRTERTLIDPIRSCSRLFTPEILSKRHFDVATKVRELLIHHECLRYISGQISFQSNIPRKSKFDNLSADDKKQWAKAERMLAFLLTQRKGSYVGLSETLDGCEAILNGKLDGLTPNEIEFKGSIDECEI